MIVKDILDEDYINYKKASMVISFPRCSWKCEKECGQRVCQNSALAKAPDIEISVEKVIDKYLKNPISKAVVCGGLEPFDSWSDLLLFVEKFREKSQDDIVIYTGYYKDEIANEINILKRYPNVVVKFGRFLPNQEKHYDEVLGVTLASPNQKAEVIS
jgi:hypothetical protein